MTEVLVLEESIDNTKLIQASGIALATLAGTLVLGMVGGAVVLGGIVTGILTLASVGAVAYHVRDRWPNFLAYMVRFKEPIDIITTGFALYAFWSMGITAGISLSFATLILSATLIFLKGIRYDDKILGPGEGSFKTLLKSLVSGFANLVR